MPFPGIAISDPAALEQRLAPSDAAAGIEPAGDGAAGDGAAGDGAAQAGATQAGAGEFWFDAPLDPALDPLEAAYRRAVLGHWRVVAGAERDWSPPLVAEPPAAAGPDALWPHAFWPGAVWPYTAGRSAFLGEALQGMGFMLAACGARSGHRALCLGLGDGNIALELARLGCAVDAVEPDGGLVGQLRAQCARLGVAVRLHQAPLAQAAERVGGRRFDRIVTHRALQPEPGHLDLLHALRGRLLAAGGRLVVGGELLLEAMPLPWGLDPTGPGLRAMRGGQPMRLMFRPSYLLAALAACGWQAHLEVCPQTALGNVFVATARRDG